MSEKMSNEEAARQFGEYLRGERKEMPKVEVKGNFRLEKFDGEHVPGDGKLPVEIIEGGDTRPFRHLVRRGDSYHEIPSTR